MSPGNLKRFLRPQILDIGCGSGRDSVRLHELGYDVVSVDASLEMCRMSSTLTGKQTIRKKYEELDYEQEFDGIWSCASLCHVSRDDMHDVLARLCRALKTGGILYISVRYGDKETLNEGRYWNYYNEYTISTEIAKIPEFQIQQVWKTADVRTEYHSTTFWLNVVVRRV